ncbi:MAG: DUF2007 domain-containing protein [Chloroflexi bacterium]|nr:DUF2007 domain-containing protein [Chloroflexota bacterium]
MSSTPRTVYLVTAPNQTIAESWAELLRREGIPCLLREDRPPASYLGVAFFPCRLLVREDRLEEAQRVLAEHTGKQPAGS